MNGLTLKSHFETIKVTKNWVIIRDLCNQLGGKSVTNDAEAVVKYLLQLHGNKRIAYYDTTNSLDELCHDGQKFLDFRFIPTQSENEILNS